MKKSLGVFSVILFIGIMLGSANATMLTSNATVDNRLRIYLSTDDSVQGLYLGDAANMDDWTKTSTYTSTLIAGSDYYLHVEGIDTAGASGFIGEFSLDSSDHIFVNNTATLLTNTSDWKGNDSGWGNPYDTALDDYGTHAATTGPWTWSFGGLQGLSDSSAHWIWAGGGSIDNPNSDYVYFSTKISATTTSPVPEPSTMILFGLGLLGLCGTTRKRK